MLELISIAKIVHQVRGLCDAGSSGIVFLTSEDNRMAQVHLNAGRVVAVVCRGKRGFAAIQLMREIHSARLSFNSGHVSASDGDELLTEVFFDYLGNLGQAPPPPPDATIAAKTTTLTPDIKITLQKLLAKYIGPMAEIICMDHFEGATNARLVIEAIAKEIPNPVDASKFREIATDAVG